ncbi:hypothetical protein LEN26_005540 [Aphanomyces euteiches]|nr:hypothetical protein AeMF1_000374 [Aphanomyces euteiches]KAH9137791.1 hypothetical protein LEN26_005540 [Aphanomyces euteiches]
MKGMISIVVFLTSTVVSQTTVVSPQTPTTTPAPLVSSSDLPTSLTTCPEFKCDDELSKECVVSALVKFTCLNNMDIQCEWKSSKDVIVNTLIAMDTQPKCRAHLTWQVNGSFRMTSNASITVASLNLTSYNFMMEDKSVLSTEDGVSIQVDQKIRVDQDAILISGGLWPGHAGGRVNISTSVFILYGEIRASGGEGICIDGRCTPGGNGGQVALTYSSVATETGSIVVSGGANPLGGKFVAGTDEEDVDDTFESGDCLSGAAGQILRIFASDKGADGLLVVSNGFNGPSGKFRRCAPITLNSIMLNPSIKRVLIESESLVHFEGSVWELHGDSELIVEDATVIGDGGAPLDITVKQLVIRGSGQLRAYSGLHLTADILSIDFGAKATWNYYASSRFVVKDSIQINGNVTTKSDAQLPFQDGGLVIQSGGDILIGGVISVPKLFALSKSNMILAGQIQAKETITQDAHYSPCSESLPVTNPDVSNYTLLLTSHGSIDMGHDSKPNFLSGSAVLICSDDSIRITSNSVVSSSGMGYSADHGIGKGECLSNLGGGAGFGGNGGDSIQIIGSQAKTNRGVGGIAYGSRSSTGHLGSGGGCSFGGSGGGLVMLGASHVELNGSILADGQSGLKERSGGGSGGFVGLTVSNALIGTGFLSASGGNSTCGQDEGSVLNATWFCGGGGSGGRLRLSGCKNFSECTDGFTGMYSVSGGKPDKYSERASVGTYYGFPCPPGYGGLLCRVCDVGTFKEERGSAECLKCQNSPSNSHYTNRGSTSSECLWSCNPGYTGKHCLSPLEDFFAMFGGELVFFSVAISAVFVIVGTGCMCKRDPYARTKYSRADTDHLVARKAWYHIRWSRLIWPRVGYPKLQEKDLEKHMARIYFSGNNTHESPLQLSTSVPNQLENVLDSDKFKNLAEQVNSILGFSAGGGLFNMLIKILCHPVAFDVMFYHRHKKFNNLKRTLAKYNHECMKGPRSKAMANAIKLGYCADYSLAYIEFLHRENDPTSCIPTFPGLVGKPHLPIVLLFAGMGTYESPLYLDPNDLLVRSVPQSPELTAFIDEAWIEIIAELNAMLRIVHLKNTLKSLSDLSEVTRYCEQKNGQLVDHNGQKAPSLGGLRMHLGRFYTNSSNDRYKWGLYLTCVENKKSTKSTRTPRHEKRSSLGIREEALHEYPNMWSPPKNLSRTLGSREVSGWNRPRDETLPIPGVLMSTDDLEEHEAFIMEGKKYVWNIFDFLPHNVPRPASLSEGWIVYIALLCFVLLDLAATLGTLVNLKCVENGMEVRTCTNLIVWPVLLVYPMAIIIAPICGLVALALSSPVAARKYGLWNSCSIINVVIAIAICYIESDKLVAPYVTRPLPLFPCAVLILKLAQAKAIDIYIADIESTRRRRGWRGLMKRRDSDTSTPPSSP